MATNLNLALRERELLARGHHDLGAHDVDAGNPFSHRVLHLHAGVHLDEIELTVLVQKLESPCTTVANLLAGRHTAFANFFDELARNAGRGRLFDHFLVAPLHGAIALAEIHRIAMLVGQNLNFNMPRVLEEFLHVHRRIAKSRPGLRLGHLHRVDQCRFGMHHPHAAPTAATRRLDDDGVAHGLGNAANLHRIFWQFTFRARHTRHARLDHGLLGRHLVAHGANVLGRRANELEAAFLHSLGEIGVLA